MGAAHAPRRYWFRHAVLTWIELPIYALRCGRVKLAASAFGAELCYIAAVVALHRARPVATLWVFMLPYVLSTLAMMFGNWCAAACLSSPAIRHACAATRGTCDSQNDLAGMHTHACVSNICMHAQ